MESAIELCGPAAMPRTGILRRWFPPGGAAWRGRSTHLDGPGVRRSRGGGGLVRLQRENEVDDVKMRLM